MPSLKPFFSHSLTMTVFNVDSAVIEDGESERVCLLLKNNCSTDMLTPGMARISHMMWVSTGNSAEWSCIQQLLARCILTQVQIAIAYLPPLECITIHTGICTTEKTFDLGHNCSLVCRCHVLDGLHEDGLHCVRLCSPCTSHTGAPVKFLHVLEQSCPISTYLWSMISK